MMRKPAQALLVASTLALAVGVSGCALGAKRSGFASKIDKSNIGVAIRAQTALETGDTATAVQLAERAVENSPTDAGFRTLLGNTYLASGRFRSAEAAYADALAIFAGQPGVALKLALTQAAQGKADAALATLDTFSGQIDSADAGLAMALAGRPGAAVELLDQVARQPGADARVRQNLALAHALAGDWTRARSVAAQDVPGDQLETRMSEWAKLAQPTSAGAQVAALIGVPAAAADTGLPTRLALKTSATKVRLAEAAPAPQPVAAPEPQVAAAEQPVEVAAGEVPAPAMSVAATDPVPALVEAAPAEAPAPAAAPDVVEMVDSLRRERVQSSGALPKVAELRRSAAKRFGKSGAVVQLGAYASQKGVKTGWSQLSRRHGAVKAYVPVSARFASAGGPVYRLSLKGFGSDSEARSLCMQLKASGAACFVRREKGDTPVRFAGR